MDSIALGRYLPLDSFMHKIDPRAKIITMILIMIAIFIPSGFIGYVLISFVILLSVCSSKLNLKFIWRSVKPMLFMMSFLLVINILMVRTGEVLVIIGGYKIYKAAIYQTLYIAIRLILMIVITTILTATTKPFDLTLGIEDLLEPLKVFKVPAHDIAMMISIALRFIPTLIEETQRIMKAQASRGVDLENGKLSEKVKAILSLIVPLFASAFQKAEELAYAMDARGYVPGRTRTRYKQLEMKTMDYLVVGIGCIVLVSTIILWIL